jgi:glycosyltransferase involved in cell wall biosynthesis
MKIAHVGWGHYPAHRTAGPIIYLHTLALAQARAGDEVTIVCASDRTIPDAPPYATQTETVEGITYVHVCNRPANLHEPWNPLREAHDPQCEQAFDEVFAELQPDVVHVHNYVGLSFDIVKAARRHAQTVLSSLHNYLPVCSRDDLFFADAELCAGPLERSCSRCLGTLVDDADYRTRHAAGVQALNDCDLVLAVSERVKEIYAEQGVDEDKLVVDRCGTPAGERLWRRVGSTRVATAAAGAEPPLDGRPLRLVFFGAGLPRKGAMVLLQAIRALKDPARVEVHIYGGVSPADMDRLNGFFNASDPRVRAAIHFNGAFTQDDLDGILANADAAVLTPRWEDNGPQTVFEALSAGLPVLATRVGGIPDVVHDGVNGFLVTEGHSKGLAAAIERLLDEPGLLAELRAGIEPPTRVREHARALRVFYARCLGRPGEQGPPLLYSCSSVDDVVGALAGALADGGRQGVTIRVQSAEVQELISGVRGDLRIEPGRIAGSTAAPPALTKTGWLARWPQDADALAGSLALGAIYPELLAGIEIGVEGDVAQAASATLERLSAEGITHESLPDMLMRPATAQDTRPLTELPAHLASTKPNELWIGDDYGDGAATGLRALEGAGDRHVALIGDELEVPHDGPLTIVTDTPLVRQIAEALGIAAASRDEKAVATADVIAVDGRRPEDLWLARAAGKDGTVVIAHGTRHTAASLRAFGLAPTAVDEPSGTVLATPVV